MRKHELEERVAELEQAAEAAIDALTADAAAVDEACEVLAQALGLAMGEVGHKNVRPHDEERADHPENAKGPLEAESV
jgi:hypothetical protein